MTNTIATDSTLATALDRLKQELHSDQSVWIAVSGGLDSCVLFDLALRELPHHQLQLIHINHQLSTQADQWQAHVIQLARSKKIPYTVEKAGKQSITHHNIEDSARQFRYKVFQKHVRARDILLLAHHANDQAETVIMRLLQGAGPHGLSAMCESTHLHGMHIVRPLLAIPKKTLLAYAFKRDLSWMNDPSNTDTRFTRNHIRNDILPALGQKYPDIERILARSAQHCHEQQRWIDSQLLLPRAPFLQNTILPFEVFIHEVPFAQKIIIRAWLMQHTGYPPSTKHMETILINVIHAKTDKNPEHRHMQWIITRFNKQLFLRSNKQPKPLEVYNWPGTVNTFHIPELNITLHKPLAYLEKKPYNQDLTIRFRKFGERFHAYNRIGSHPLKKCMQEWRIPPWQRKLVPLIYNGNALVCVVDYAITKMYSDLPCIYSKSGNQGGA